MVHLNLDRVFDLEYLEFELVFVYTIYFDQCILNRTGKRIFYLFCCKTALGKRRDS